MGGDVSALADCLGITPDDARQCLKDYYDGYHFTPDSPDIYNPFSLLSAFARGRIAAFWFGSGTPTVLLDVIRARGWQIVDLTEVDAMESEFDAPTERAATPTALLYQSGYLTIKAYDEEAHVYTLGIPNREVSRGLSESLVVHAAPDALGTHNGFLIKLARALRAGNVEQALQQMRAYLAGIPYHLGSRDERGFETTFYLIFDLLGIQIETEFKYGRRARGRRGAHAGRGLRHGVQVRPLRRRGARADRRARLRRPVLGGGAPGGQGGRQLLTGGADHRRLGDSGGGVTGARFPRVRVMFFSAAARLVSELAE